MIRSCLLLSAVLVCSLTAMAQAPSQSVGASTRAIAGHEQPKTQPALPQVTVLPYVLANFGGVTLVETLDTFVAPDGETVTYYGIRFSEVSECPPSRLPHG